MINNLYRLKELFHKMPAGVTEKDFQDSLSPEQKELCCLLSELMPTILSMAGIIEIAMRDPRVKGPFKATAEVITKQLYEPN